MYDISNRNIKKGNGIYFIMLLIGIVLLVGAFFVFNSVNNKKKALTETITSTRMEIDTEYNSDGNLMETNVYYYTVNGVEYSCRSNVSRTSTSGVKIGTDKTIYYDPANPANCSVGSPSSNYMGVIIMVFFGLIILILAIINISKSGRKRKDIDILNKRGKLVKNLPYRLEESKIEINGRPIQRIVVDYTLPTGSVVTLYSEPLYDNSFSRSGYADIVIDESNPSVYFVDFEINRLNGNLPGDYNAQSQTSQSMDFYASNQSNGYQDMHNNMYNNQNNNF